MVFASAKLEAFVIVRGEPVRRRSSDHGERWHCGACGSPIAMRVDEEPSSIDVAVGSLDDPEASAPGFHIWHESRIGWFETKDALKRFPRSRRE